MATSIVFSSDIKGWLTLTLYNYFMGISIVKQGA